MDLDRLDAEGLIQKLTDSLESANDQPLVNHFKSITDNALSVIKGDWKEEFYKAKTDFQRVCYLLKAIDSSMGKYKHGVDKLGLNTTSEDVAESNGKSDEISVRYFSYATLALKEGDRNASLTAIAKAVFYATSPKQLAKALARRCKILHRNELYDDAIEDGLRVLKLPCSQSEMANIHLILGHCNLEKKAFTESKSHYTQALTMLGGDSRRKNSQSCLDAERGINECISAEDKNEECQYHPRWKCIRAKAPDLKEVEKNLASSDTEVLKTDDLNSQDPKLLSVPNRILRLKYTGSAKCGWTMELTRNVSTGEILIVEKPWAISLWRERTRYCYYCCKRCHNLIPCSNCPHVGFCSEECKENSTESEDLSKDGNKHIYDCQGLGPAIIFDDNIESIHTAYNCFVKVSPKRLLDYIYSTGPYASGRGHQAFKGAEEIRRAPPSVFDPSDYSSIAFLTGCSEERLDGTLEYFTKAAVSLTFCLYLEGYPMTWFEETDIFFCDPSSCNRPEVIPASWIAACLLYHIQAVDVNYFGMSEAFSKSTHTEEFATTIYPTISLINHSCNPNAAVKCTGQGVAFLHTLRPLQAGSEISISYKPPFYSNSTQDRRELLQAQFYFNCECVACSNDWSKGSIFGPESILCQNCQKVFIENEEGCPVCKSRVAVSMLKQFREEVVPKLRQFLLKDTCSLEDLKYATTSADKVLPFIKQPSLIYHKWKDLYADILSSIYGNRTIEVWAESDTSESSCESENV